jgi:DNA replication protein DnaC
MNVLLDSRWSALYTTVHELIRDIRGTWHRNSDEDESDVLERYRKTSLLVLDEVGASLGGEAEQSQLFDLLDWRYRNMKPNLIISNLSETGLQQCLGDRLYDRLTEIGSAVVTFNWKSERQLGQARRDSQHSADPDDRTVKIQSGSKCEVGPQVADERPGKWIEDPDSGERLWIAE